MADKNKKVVLKYQISGGYYRRNEDGTSANFDYPKPFEEVSLPEDVADSLLASNQAWTPAQYKKVAEKE